MKAKIQLGSFSRLTLEKLSISHWRLLLISFMFLASFGIRLYHLNAPPLDYHAVRQYHSLIIAKSLYYDTLSQETSSAIPGWKKQIAGLNRQRQRVWEPPIMEGLTVVGYHLAGGEYFWIPRLLAAILWCLGGVFLYQIAQRINDLKSGAAVFSTAFYLFLPFGVSASRSFQPEPLMIMALVASIYVMLRYYELPSTSRLFLTAAVWALAFLIKGISVFPILISFLFIGMNVPGYRQVVFRVQTLILLVGALLPTILFYTYGIFISKSLLGVATGNILPHILLLPSFWKGWVEQIGTVVGYTALVGAFLGTLLLREGLPRGLLLGLWCGYVAFGLIFSYPVHTHDYWNLQIVPIAALALGPLAALIIHHICRMNPHWFWQVTLVGILLFAALILFVLARPKSLPTVLERKVQVAQEVGTLVSHSTRTIFLSSDYGLPLEYHGELSGVPWPITSDLEWEKLAGVKTLAAKELYRTRFQVDSPEYFIVLDLAEFDAQPDLRDFLTRNFHVFAHSDDYLIFDLTK